VAKKPAKRWMVSPRQGPKPKASAVLQKEVTQRANKLVEEVLKPARLQAEPPIDFNYVVNISIKWHGSTYFYFIGTWRCPAPNCLSEFFEMKFTRLEYTGEDRFSLAYMRHTGQWFTVLNDVPLGMCLTEIEHNELYWP
jgi:hypothetical protein